MHAIQKQVSKQDSVKKLLIDGTLHHNQNNMHMHQAFDDALEMQEDDKKKQDVLQNVKKGK